MHSTFAMLPERFLYRLLAPTALALATPVFAFSYMPYGYERGSFNGTLTTDNACAYTASLPTE